MVDKVHPLKMEYPAEGGTEEDLGPTGLDPHEDYVDARGLTIQNDTSSDTAVIVSRDSSSNLILSDAYQSQVTLTQLLSSSLGCYYTSSASEDTSTTSSASFQDKCSVTTDAISGPLLVQFVAEASVSFLFSSMMKVRLYNTTDSTEYCLNEYTPHSSGDWQTVSGLVVVTMSGSAKTFKVQFASNGTNTASIRRTRIIMWRLNQIGDFLDIEAHKSLRQLIHFIDEGPGDGFTSGAYKEIVGGVFPTSITWYTSSAKTHKIVEKTITRSGGGATNICPTPVVYKIYAVDGSTVLAEVSDAIAYDGILEINRTRTITVY